MSRWLPALALALGLGACVFAPDLSRFDACDAQGRCAEGFTCLETEGLCLPDCGARGPCIPDVLGDDDAGVTDAGVADAGPSDAGVADAGGPDAGVADAGVADAGMPDAGPPDAGPPDAGGTDAGMPDAGVPDAGMPDAGSVSLRLAGPGILADFVSGQSYEEQLSAVGGRSPYRFELAQGSTLPAGLVLGADGLVQGSTSAPGTSFQVQVTDASQPAQKQSRTLQITSTNCAFGDLCLRTRALPDGRVGQAYSYFLRATPRSTTPTWKVESGALPPGVELLRDTGQLAGTPTQAGTYSVTISATELLSTTAPRSFSVEIIF